MKLTDRIGAVLVVSGKPRVQASVRAAISAKYGRVLTAETVQEARILVERERIGVMLLFTPLKDEEEIYRLLDTADRRNIAAAYIVNREIYGETVYRMDGRNVYVLAYPLQMDQVLQTTGFLCQAQHRFGIMKAEQERLRQQLQNQQLISRVKCLLVERRQMTEEEAHHLIEREAMNSGSSKREAASRILKEL